MVEERLTMHEAAIPHSQIPEACTCKWVPIGNGLWNRTDEPFPGFEGCTFDHERAYLEGMTVEQLRGLARNMGLSSTTRLNKQRELVAAIARARSGDREKPVTSG
jgi:Rho termination factor-like protein